MQSNNLVWIPFSDSNELKTLQSVNFVLPSLTLNQLVPA